MLALIPRIADIGRNLDCLEPLVGTGLQQILAGCAPAATLPVAQAAASDAIAACFTPGENCEGVIVAAIGAARKTIKVQAYSFTSKPIAEALLAAHARGIDVRIIVDKSQRRGRSSVAARLADAGMPVLVDERPAIAHSKIVLIDDQGPDPIVITGSFNFTKSAETRNAENLVEISGDRALARRYAENFARRAALSVPFGR